MGVFLITFCYSQETKPVTPINTPLTNNNANFSMSSSAMWAYKTSSVPTVLGSNYLFNNWLNSASIYTIDKKDYKISGINFNVKNNRFEARISDVSKEDSTFVFNSNYIDRVVVGQREFVKKEVVDKRTNYFVEIVHQGYKISLLKLYSTRVILGASDPMTKEKMSDDKIVIKSTYYIERNSQLEETKLNKYSILKLMSDKKSEVKGFLKDNKVSFRHEEDVKKIFVYYNSI